MAAPAAAARDPWLKARAKVRARFERARLAGRLDEEFRRFDAELLRHYGRRFPFLMLPDPPARGRRKAR